MQRSIRVVGAPTSIGIRPYDDGTVRRLDEAPGVLRRLGLVERLGAADFGDVMPRPYKDFERPSGRPRNEREVAEYTTALADRVAAARSDDSFVLVLGGDCSIVLGCLLGLRGVGRVGLAYVDAHSDFATPEESYTGSVASMCLAMAVGRGDSPLARVASGEPVARVEDVVVVGRSDHTEDGRYGEDAMREMGVADLAFSRVRADGEQTVALEALERLTRPELDGFWIHVDADVLDGAIMPAVDSPADGGLSLDALAELLRPLVDHPRALGMELTIYDPGLDPDGVCGARLASLLEEVLAPAGR